MKKLTEVQGMISEIFQYIYRYLQDQKMEYYMLGGTLLGAVRHQGFIPWDDDMDIGLPRDAYERFVSEIGDYLPEHLKLRTWWDNSSHHYYFSRIVDTRHSMKRCGSLTPRNEEVWVDIFPLDGMPNSALRRELHKLRLLAIRVMVHISCFDKVNLKRPNRPLSERIIIRFVLITGFGRKADPKRWLTRLDRTLKKYPLDQSDYIVNFMGQYLFREMFPRSWFGKGRMYLFEGQWLTGPENYDAVLTRMYGDYRTPPKDSEKNAHAAELIREQRPNESC